MLQDGIEGVYDLATKIPVDLMDAGVNALDKLTGNKFDFYNQYNQIKDKSRSTQRRYNARNRHLLKAKEHAGKVLKSQKETFNKFNNYVIQSRDRFGKETNSKSDTNLRNDKLTERTNRETKF